MASPDYSDGCMIALYPPQQLAEDLAVPGGLDPAEMHVTIAYLGDTADVDRDKLLAAAQALAGRGAIEGSISGHARFTGGEQDVIVALVDSADLEDLRRDTLARLTGDGIDIHRNHGYTPHLTITYLDQAADAPLNRLPSVPVTFGSVSAVYGQERTNFPFLPAETSLGPPARVAAENATIQLSDPQGIWRPVYARRLALHAAADAIIVAAWRADIQGLNLAPAVDEWRMAVGEAADPMVQHRRDAAATAVLTTLATRAWTRTKAAIALAAKRAHHAGWAAGNALVTQDHGDGTPYDEPDSGNSLSPADLSDNAAAGTATAVLGAALRATAKRAGRAMADSTGGPEADAEDAVDDGTDIALAADVAVSAAYGTGLLAAYVAAGRQSVNVITAGDGRVCAACESAEANGPYSLLAAPSLPLHARCRCSLISN